MNSNEHILREFLAANHTEGVVIPKEYFWNLFGLIEPKGRVNFDEAQKAQLNFSNCLEPLRRDLLRFHQRDLQNVYSKGYELVPYLERVDKAVKDMKKSINRELKKGYARLIHIPHPENLSYPEQRNREYALQMAAALQRDLRAKPRYPK